MLLRFPPSAPTLNFHGRRAFTLVELLVVVGVIVIMMTLALPAFNAISGGTNFTSEIYDMAGTLEQARVYAMSNNTYVLAGFWESPGTLSTSATPQISGTGRITMIVIASQTGTRPYNTSSNSALAAWLTQSYNTGLVTLNASGVTNGGFLPVTKVMQFQNVHMVDLQSPTAPPTTGNMARPSALPYCDIPNATCVAANAFAWPLGTKPASFTSPPQSPTQYLITKVIEFDPQGSARVINSTYLDAIPRCIEIGLEPSHGGVAAGPPTSQNTGQIAAIQIDGMNSAIHIYRP